MVDNQTYNLAMPANTVEDRGGPNPNLAIALGQLCWRKFDTTPPHIIAYEPPPGAPFPRHTAVCVYFP